MSVSYPHMSEPESTGSCHSIAKHVVAMGCKPVTGMRILS